MYQLFQKGKVLLSSTRKLDAIFEHQKYRRRDRVAFRENIVKKNRTH